MLKKTIIWHKWVDPLIPLVKDTEVCESLENAPFGQDEHDANDSFMFHNLQQQLSRPSQKGYEVGPILMGSAGIIPVYESAIPSKIYNFWMGHTNFHITDRVFQTMDSFPGVESLTIYSPYRFRIAIGLAFNPKEVRENLTAALTKLEKKQKSLLTADEKLKTLGSPFWAKVYQEDGKYSLYLGKSIDEVESKINESGTIYRSWEE